MAAQGSTDSPAGLPVDNPTISYWHSEPSEILLGHRTTQDLPQAADVVIVGSGMTGACAAHVLKESAPDLKVVMLEAREACWGATGRNGGHCAPEYYIAPPHIAAFELRTYLYLKHLVETYSIPCNWRTTTGVHGYYSPELFKTAKEIVRKVQVEHPDLGAKVEVVTKRESTTPSHPLNGGGEELTLEGLRVSAAEGAVVELKVASFWPYKFVAFLLERLLAAGDFNLQTNTSVTSLERINIGAELHSSHGKGWTVHTPRGDISAQHVLLATNAYTSHLLPQLADIIVPVKGQVASLTPPPPPPLRPEYAPLDIGNTYWFASDLAKRRDDYLIQCPPPGAELILGGGRIHAERKGLGVWDDSTIDEPVARYLKGELGNLMDLSSHQQKEAHGDPETRVPKQDLEPTFEWSGIMGFSRDGSPWVGPVPETAGGGDGLWICAGYTGNGMPNAALCAKAAATMIISGQEGGLEVDLPPEYLFTENRLERARRCDTIAEADKKGAFF